MTHTETITSIIRQADLARADGYDIPDPLPAHALDPAHLRRLLGPDYTPPRPIHPAPPARQIESPYLSAREAAAYLGISYGTFRNWSGQIRRTRTGKYTRDALDQFVKTRKK